MRDIDIRLLLAAADLYRVDLRLRDGYLTTVQTIVEISVDKATEELIRRGVGSEVWEWAR